MKRQQKGDIKFQDAVLIIMGKASHLDFWK
jgi:hypothetical protein